MCGKMYNAHIEPLLLFPKICYFPFLSSSFRSPSHLQSRGRDNLELSSAAPLGIPTAYAELPPPQAMLSVSTGQGVDSPYMCCFSLQCPVLSLNVMTC